MERNRRGDWRSVPIQGPAPLPHLVVIPDATPNKDTVSAAPSASRADSCALYEQWAALSPQQQGALAPWFLSAPSEDWSRLMQAERVRSALPDVAARAPAPEALRGAFARLRAETLRPADEATLSALIGWVHARANTAYTVETTGVFLITWAKFCPDAKLHNPRLLDELIEGLRRRALLTEAARLGDGEATAAQRARAKVARDTLWIELQEALERALRRRYPGLGEEARLRAQEEAIDRFVHEATEGRFCYQLANCAEPVLARLFSISRNAISKRFQEQRREVVSTEEALAAQDKDGAADQRAPAELRYSQEQLLARCHAKLEALITQNKKRDRSLGQLRRALALGAGAAPPREAKDTAARKRKERGLLYLREASHHDPEVRELFGELLSADPILEALDSALKLLRRGIRTRLPRSYGAALRRLLGRWRALELLLAQADDAQRRLVEARVAALPEELQGDMRFLIGYAGPRRRYATLRDRSKARWDNARLHRAEQELINLRALLRARAQPRRPRVSAVLLLWLAQPEATPGEAARVTWCRPAARPSQPQRVGWPPMKGARAGPARARARPLMEQEDAGAHDNRPSPRAGPPQG